MAAVNEDFQMGREMEKRYKEVGVPAGEAEVHIKNHEDVIKRCVSKNDLALALKSERIITLSAFFCGNLALIGALIKLLGANPLP